MEHSLGATVAHRADAGTVRLRDASSVARLFVRVLAAVADVAAVAAAEGQHEWKSVRKARSCTMGRGPADARAGDSVCADAVARADRVLRNAGARQALRAVIVRLAAKVHSRS